jgi:hypothetical protein
MRKYFQSFRGNLTALIILAAIVPLLFSGLIIGTMLDNQLRTSLENRLKAGLETFSLILDYRGLKGLPRTTRFR